jgi:vacuolar-type H+-ATPase subunit E/Vma4
MAFTQSDLDNINAAVATGELHVEVNGRKVVYRSMDDLMKARTIITGELASAAAGVASTTRRGSYRVNFSTHRGD